jgi:hypothetical protein
MVHKKYIKKNGKKYGPYLYENYRENGITKTRYLGKYLKEKKKKRWFRLKILSIVILFISVLYLSSFYITPEFVGTTLNTNTYSLVDYLQGFTLSSMIQTSEIFIEGAEHLDSNKDFISDIYDEVKELDGIWSKTIYDQEYVRVSFEIELDDTKDITIFPRIISGTPKIEVYEVGGDEVIAEFSSLKNEEYNKVFLTNLRGNQDVFDLRILGGDVQLDHIVDPNNPNLTSVILNSTSFNLTSDNLTAYPVNATNL